MHSTLFKHTHFFKGSLPLHTHKHVYIWVGGHVKENLCSLQNIMVKVCKIINCTVAVELHWGSLYITLPQCILPLHKHPHIHTSTHTQHTTRMRVSESCVAYRISWGRLQYNSFLQLYSSCGESLYIILPQYYGIVHVGIIGSDCWAQRGYVSVLSLVVRWWRRLSRG